MKRLIPGLVIAAMAACGPSKEDIEKSLKAKQDLDFEVTLLTVVRARFERCIALKTINACEDIQKDFDQQIAKYKRAEAAYVEGCRKCAPAGECERDRRDMERPTTRTSVGWTPCVK